MRQALKRFGLMTLLTVLVGCGGTPNYMQEVTDPNVSYNPNAGEAMVVFMRPSSFAMAIQSALFDVSGPDNKLIGVLSAKKKIAYITQPGKHLFMVTGESADFMQADLKAGKIYYALVNPRMGAWKARFSLGAVHQNIEPDKLNKWKSGCSWVETNAASYEWAKENGPSIQSKRDAYIEKWQGKPADGKPTLHPEDGF